MLIKFQIVSGILAGGALLGLSQDMLFTGACFTSASLAVLMIGLLKHEHMLGSESDLMDRVTTFD
jgi:hypothetical protein